MTWMTLRSVAFFAATLLLSACNISLDAPLLPNVGKHFPEGTNEAQASKDLTVLSKAQGGTKKWLVNFVLDKDLTDDLDLDRENNCVQLSEFSDRTVVVDFYDVRCPANSEVGPTERLKFTAAYSPMAEERNHYKVKLTGRDVGEMQISSDGSELTLLRLCTGKYDANCLPSISGRKFIGAPTLLF